MALASAERFIGCDECARAFGNPLLEFAGDAKQRVQRHLCD